MHTKFHRDMERGLCLGIQHEKHFERLYGRQEKIERLLTKAVELGLFATKARARRAIIVH